MAAPLLVRLPATGRASTIALIALALIILSHSGDASSGASIDGPNFVPGTVGVSIDTPTSLAFGPDGRLYAASFLDGKIVAYTLDPARKIAVDQEVIASGLEDVMGIAFDPTAPDSPVVLYASRREASDTDGFESRISKFTGPTWTMTDVIAGLPTSRPNLNHLTNGLAFDTSGRLFIAQGSATDAGLRGPLSNDWTESPLSAAILVADIHAPGFDGNVMYDPASPPTTNDIDKVSGDVEVFTPGLRNPFDLLLHSNGNIYATDNGPFGPGFSLTCNTSGSGVSTSDELNLIEQGDYYGHPNRNRGRTDARQCTYHKPEEGSDVDFTGPIAILPAHCSCDGIAEYTNGAFGGAMQGDLIIAAFQLNHVKRMELSGDGSSVVSNTILPGSFSRPLDVTVGPDGTIYVAEFGSNTVSYLAPDTDRDGCADSRELGPQAQFGGRRDPNWFWDFFDTPDAGNVRDRIVDIGDILRVVLRFGANQGPPPSKEEALAQALSAPSASGYHASFDRSAPDSSGDPWDLNPPDGMISVGDILFAVFQFGHSCAANG